MLRARLGEEEAAVREVEGRQRVLGRELDAGGLPVEPPGDHQVQHQPQLVVQPQGDPLADAADLPDGLAARRIERRIEGPDEERAVDPDPLETLADDALSSAST